MTKVNAFITADMARLPSTTTAADIIAGILL